jgi:DNA (cytosine-5)-methyltransferase 1
MTTFYNEWDAKTAAWLRELCKQGLVTNGVVDERSITELRGEDLRGYGRVHLFAGIGGWDYALKLAGWPDDRPVWTGSCPCQPFSAAGKRKGQADERHLWPEMFRLVRECLPAVCFLEQVAAAIGCGWLDEVAGDLESVGYEVWPCVLPACEFGGMYVGNRLYIVATSQAPSKRRERCGRIARTRTPHEFERLVQEAIRVSVPAGRTGGVSDGLSSSVAGVAIKGYGNAIDPEVAAAFVRAFMESEAHQ